MPWPCVRGGAGRTGGRGWSVKLKCAISRLCVALPSVIVVCVIFFSGGRKGKLHDKANKTVQSKKLAKKQERGL